MSDAIDLPASPTSPVSDQPSATCLSPSGLVQLTPSRAPRPFESPSQDQHQKSHTPRVTEALATVGLADRADHLPSEMSGGEQQRVGIARALVKEPNVLLADEPTGNLDVDTRDEIMALLEALWRDRGLTLVLVTHDTSIARRAQRVATMHDGHLSIATDEQTQPDPATDGRNRPDLQ